MGNSYAWRDRGHKFFSVKDSLFKIYYIDLYGRPFPERFEWEKSSVNEAIVDELLINKKITGVGFVVAFPHLIKVFRFGKDVETNLYLMAFRSPDLSEIELKGEDDFYEFACLAESIISNHEFQLWADAQSVSEYLSRWAELKPSTVNNTNKLAQFLS